MKNQTDTCNHLHEEYKLLGYIISTDGIRPNPEKSRDIKELPNPQTQKEIKSFLGLLAYYGKFIRDFAEITKPLTECLKKGRKVILYDRYLKTFEN